MLSSTLLNEVDDHTDHTLIGDILDMIFRPLESQEGHLVRISIIVDLFASAVDDVGDLVGFEEINILN